MTDSSEANVHLLDYWRVIRYRWPFLLIAFIIVTGAAGVTCYFLPREYYARITIEVKPDDTTFKIFSNDITPRGNSDSRMGPTQFRIVRSKDVLYPVIKRLKLDEAWGRGGEVLPMDATYIMLLKSLGESKEIRGTDMFEIGVYSTDPAEAAAIVNTIGQEYQNRRHIEQESRLRQGLANLESEVAKKRVEVDQALEEMVRIREEDGIVDLSPESIAQAESPERDIVAKSELELGQMKSRVTELRSQLEETRKLDPTVLLSAMRTLGIDDSNVSRLQPMFQSAIAEEARLLSSGIGANHPRIKSLQAQKNVIYKQLEEELTGVQAALNTRLKVAETTLDALEKKVESERENFNATRKRSVSYTTAKEKYLTAKSMLQSTETRLETLSMQGRMAIHPARIWDQADPPRIPSKPNVLLYMSLAIGGGLVVGFGLIFFLEYIDTSVKTVEEVEAVLKVPVLAVVPKDVPYLAQITHDAPDSEAYRVLQTNIDLARAEKPGKTITFVSGGVGEGKSTTLSNLACTYASAGMRTLVVDADVRRAFQHEIYGCDRMNGLSEVLEGKTDWRKAVRSTKIPNLSFMPAGQLHGASKRLLLPEKLKPLLEELKQEYDIIFFDSPPILGLSDSSVIVSLMDITLMVVQYRRFPRSMLMRVQQGIQHAQGNLYGVVLNGVDVSRDLGYQYYTQYYDYYGEDRPKKSQKSSKSPRPAETVPQGDY